MFSIRREDKIAPVRGLFGVKKEVGKRIDKNWRAMRFIRMA